MNLATFEARAQDVADTLALPANQRRLTVLCKLSERREQNLVTFRRDGQTLWYRLAESRVEALLATPYSLYCTESPVHPAASHAGTDSDFNRVISGSK